MSNRPEPSKPWSPNRVTFYGALLGLIVGIVHAYIHAFWSQPHEEDLAGHILWMMALYVVGGAALSAAIAVIRNWLARNRA